jgi:hypothetical protein
LTSKGRLEKQTCEDYSACLFVELSARIPQFKGDKACQKRRRIKLANYAFHVAQTSR